MKSFLLFYILGKDGKTPVATEDYMLHAQFMSDHTRSRVALSRDEEKGISVSTVFLGLDHNYSDNGPPILFETVVFGGPQEGRMNRYATWSEAEKGHNLMCARVGIPWNLRDAGKEVDCG